MKNWSGQKLMQNAKKKKTVRLIIFIKKKKKLNFKFCCQKQEELSAQHADMLLRNTRPMLPPATTFVPTGTTVPYPPPGAYNASGFSPMMS